MIRLYNTLSRAKEEFTPLDGKKARIYCCGPTVYNYAHIGNLRTYVFEDILIRALKHAGVPTLHVVNITDVGHLTSDADEGEDKMEKGAKREGKSVWEIAQYYTDAFKRDIALLNITEPDIWCKATDNIPEQIAQIEALERNGLTYRTEDGIYFDTAKLEDYGKLARLKKDELKAGARIDMGEKRSATDFALWKFSPKDAQRQMEWDSPWGKGFPGWHIECSAMSMKHLGEQFDIHCGGIDHISVHHTNEIAQAEGATGKKPWVRFWLHGEFLVIDQGKMAKSGENFLTLQTLIGKGYEPLAYRYFCLTANYRQQLKFSWEALDSAKSSYESLRSKLRDLRENPKEGTNDTAQQKAAFLDAISDDLNMPKALAVLWETLRDETLASDARIAAAEGFDAVLGLSIADTKTEDIPEEIAQLAKEREQARKDKDWATSDKLRDKIRDRGYIVEDKETGSVVRKST